MRLRDRYRWQILLKSEKLELLHGVMHSFEGEIASLGKARKVKISVDVDPEYTM
jgi:primosomal protein N'